MINAILRSIGDVLYYCWVYAESTASILVLVAASVFMLRKSQFLTVRGLIIGCIPYLGYVWFFLACLLCSSRMGIRLKWRYMGATGRSILLQTL